MPEQRITGLTLRILGVNLIALIILAVGVVYLGQYQKSLIEAKLETFKIELDLVTAALRENAINLDRTTLPADPTRQMVLSLSERMRKGLGQRVRVFGDNGQLIADSTQIFGPGGTIIQEQLPPLKAKQRLQSVEMLASAMKMVLSLLPQTRTLPRYPQPKSNLGVHFPDVQDAMNGQLSLSAWSDKDDTIFLSAAAPIYIDGEIVGSVLLTRYGRDIEEEITQVWLNVITIFLGTFLITVLLSIYLTGLIEQPLRKLARAAEKVRGGKGKPSDIPDLSNRNDEIGRLSLVLRDMTQALWDRMDMMESFAADVSHELKNPLTSLKSAIETLGVVKKAKDRERLMDIIHHDVGRLDRLITDISQASRLDTELSREEFAPVNIKKLLMNLLDSYQDPLERQKVTGANDDIEAKAGNRILKLRLLSSESLYTAGIESRLAQVFQNLISNALSFSPKQGAVRITLVHMNGSLEVRVEDEGPGIPENKLESIFERFYSERPESENFGNHSGLGLSICKQIINAHNGEIFAENITNEKGAITGARFTVILKRLQR